MGKAVRYIVVLVLAVCYFVPKPDCLLSMDFPAHLLHHFFHANVFHFAINALAIWAILDPRTRPQWWLLPLAYAVGSFSYCFAIQPTIGFSNIIYALAGIRTPSFRSSWWKQPSVKTFLIVMVVMCFLPWFSATTHIAAYIFGVGFSSVIRFSKGLDYDTRRAAGSK